MKIILSLFLAVLIFSCKTKEAIPEEQLLKFVVILKQSASPKDLKKDISFNLIAYNALDESLNQWIVDYKGLPKDAKKLRTSLLSHSKVVSVFTMDQYEKLKLKQGKKSDDGAFGSKRISKQ